MLVHNKQTSAMWVTAKREVGQLMYFKILLALLDAVLVYIFLCPSVLTELL